MNKQLEELYLNTMNRLSKWRKVFTGWQLGTRATSDPESQAVSDMNEARIILRVELNAISSLLIEKKVFSEDEYFAKVIQEAEAYNLILEERFPGFKAEDWGIRIDAVKALQTTKGWKP